MIPELGHYALILSLAWAILLSVLPLIGVYTERYFLMGLAKPLTLVYGACVFLAFFLLIYAFGANDFSVLYIAENSHRQLPLIYRLCAIWGAHEGSLLLWIVLLAFWMVLVAWRSQILPIPFRARVLSVMGLISIGFLWFLLQTSNPFVRLFPVPTNGQDLNPLLQDPGFVSHPPILYCGYVGFAVAFAFAVSALLSKNIEARWVDWVRPWTLAAWSFLTLGIVLGSWWAYRELGWGGWWFWDPVENASLMPWLVGTALIHSLIVTAKRGIFSAWTVWLAICAFSLSLLGTFLVRSGVLISVHAFAVDSARGIFILRYLAVVIGGALLLYALRAGNFTKKTALHFWSRETFILLNNMLLTVAAVTVLLGTLYPLLLDALTGEKISVGVPYFNTVFAPIMIILMICMGFAPLTAWTETKSKILQKKVFGLLTLAFIAAIVFTHIIPGTVPKPVSVILFLSTWVILSVITATWQARRGQHLHFKLRRFGMLLAHVGFAVTALGAVLATFLHESSLIAMQPGQTTTLSGYSFSFDALNTTRGPNYQSDIATISVRDGAENLTTLYPEKRFYPVRMMALSKVGLAVNLWRDIYVAIGDQIPNSPLYAVRIYIKPAVRWLWYGGLLMLCGGLCCLLGLALRPATLSEQAHDAVV